jgi:hypothetical protein
VQVEVEGALTILGADGSSSTALEGYLHDYETAGDKADSSGTASAAAPGVVGVLSNHEAGYTLSLADADTDTDLERSAGDTSGIQTYDGLPVAGTPTWAVAVSGKLASRTAANATTLPTGSATWQAMPASDGAAIKIADTSGVSNNVGDYYAYAFATSIAATTPAGTYADTVTFTLTPNN